MTLSTMVLITMFIGGPKADMKYVVGLITHYTQSFMASAGVDTQEMGMGLQRCSLTFSDSSKIVLIYIPFATNVGLLDLFIMCWGNSLLCCPTVYSICSVKLYMEWMFRVVNVLLQFAKPKVWYDYALVYKTLIALFLETDCPPFQSCYRDKIVPKSQKSFCNFRCFWSGRLY